MPNGKSSKDEWVEFHRHNARMFKSMSITDPGRKDEALWHFGIQLRCIERHTGKPEWKTDYESGRERKLA
ncbi:AMED_5909 family protein [Amycolatopsis iheyensis]|uniref:AMED_5909 family protein n=1 Tax=Amycolatopsis iheyensis TaxID=2945988 RepID=UPI003558A87C